MNTKKFTFTGANGYILNGIIWVPECTPTKIVQVTHGMTEHIGRYSDLAKELTSNGIVLAGFDLRGHGANAVDTDCASFNIDGWENSIEDMHLFFDHLNNEFPDVPHYMMGFSLGSFLLREYLNIYPNGISGSIIMGTGYQPKIITSLLMLVVKGQIKRYGFNNTTKLVQDLSFGTYNKKFRPNSTDSDWLCSDKEQLYNYLNDNLCKKSISSGLFYQLLNSMNNTAGNHTYDNWNKHMPVLLISGMNDPVGNFGDGVTTLRNKMIDNGITNITTFLLFDARHDILHEKINGTVNYVYKILIEWINNG